MTLFRDSVFKKVIKLKWAIRVGTNPIRLLSLTKEEIWTQTGVDGKPCENTEKIAIHKPMREASEETCPADTLILDFRSPELCVRT